MMMTASVLMLVSLTWERHFAICYPHQYRIRIRTIPLWRHLARYIVPVVVLSFVLNIPKFINTYKVCTSNHCWYLSPKFQRNHSSLCQQGKSRTTIQTLFRLMKNSCNFWLQCNKKFLFNKPFSFETFMKLLEA